MANGKKKATPAVGTSDSGKSIATQLSDLRLENKALRKLHSSQQAQINELQGQLAQLWAKIGM